MKSGKVRGARSAARKASTAKSGDIRFPEEDYKTFEQYLAKRVGGDWILAIDPGTSSTGWAAMDPFNGEEILSGHGPAYVIARELTRAGHGSALLWVVERPYAGRNPEAAIDDDGKPFLKGAGRASPDGIWKLGRAMGFVEGALDVDRWLRDMQPPLVWTPRPGSWRAVLDLNPSAKGKAAREEASERAWRYARAHAKRPLEGPMGGRHIDEAMAICMLLAARKIAKAVGEANGRKVGAALEEGRLL